MEIIERKYCGDVLKDNNGISLSSKCNKGEITNKEYQDESAKRRGFKDYAEYQDELAKRRGFKDFTEYHRHMNHKFGRYLPMNENKDCSLYLGVYIAENVLSKTFKNIKRYPSNNEGFDFICENGYKIDVKSSCLRNGNFWAFTINKNKIADYFLLIAFNDRENLNPLHIWLIKCNEIVKNYKINERYNVTIMNGVNSIKRLEQYELIDKLNDVKILCDKFKNDNIIYENKK